VVALLRPGFPFRSLADFLRALAKLVREAGPVPDVGPIPYCDDGAALVGLPEEIAGLRVRGMRCTSCVSLALYEAALAHQAGEPVDLCCSVTGTDTEHAWIRVRGERRDPSAKGGLSVPESIYVGAVIVPVELNRP
jgi:hypothetical protein